jgi:phosphoglycolate phosphatase-like HAD superfamily hydrolase
MDLLIFDMDGVLIDVSGSYRKTIQQTIKIYLETCLGFRRRKNWLVTDEEVSLFKSVGGFNNDWDLTSGILLYLLSISGIPPFQKRKKFSNIQDVVSYLITKSSKFQLNTSSLSQKIHLDHFLKKVKSSGGGLKGVRLALKASWDGWVYHSGDLDRENLVKRIFQEVYLGRKFHSYYHLRPLFYKGKGLYLQESLLIPRKILSLFRKKLRMGIATGRPRFEAELAMKRFNLTPYFDSVVTLDECVEEEYRIFHSTGMRMNLLKPHPYCLLRVIQEIGISNPLCGYIGDVVDDIRSAKAIKKDIPILAIGFIGHRANRKVVKESLLHAGADLIIENPKELLQFIA